MSAPAPPVDGGVRRAKERLAAAVALLEAAIPDPLQRLAIINAIIDYGNSRALGAIDNISELLRRSSQ